MKRSPNHLVDFLLYVSVYPLLIFIVIVTGLSFGIGSNLASHLTGLLNEPGPTRTWRLVVLPAVSPTPSSISEFAHSATKPDIDSDEVEEHALLPTMSPTSTFISGSAFHRTDNTQHFVPIQASLRKQPIPPRFSTPTPTAAFELANVMGGSTFLSVSLPTLTSTPTLTASSILAPTPTQTPTPMITHSSTVTPASTTRATSTNTPLPTDTATPTPTATASPIPSATSSPTPTLTPVPDYDFMLAEFYNSPTTNSFLLIYVAIVDPQEIPIGDMKLVGTRLDNNMTYESPLSTWYYEGYNAPSKHIKSGNVKFEPPGGIEYTSWVVHLEDAHGNRQSVDIPFDVDKDNKQWYFIKLRRKY